jgi:hypothetical protein
MSERCSYCDRPMVAVGFKARRAGAIPQWVVFVFRMCVV